MKQYKTVNEVKEHLPEILDRINACKLFFDCGTIMLEEMQNMCVRELTDPNYDGGWWTTTKAYAETLRNQTEWFAEIEYLTRLIKRLPQYKDQPV